METDDGALVYVTYNGVADLGENGYQDALNQTGPATIKIHAAPRCATAHPAYQWLNRAQCLLIGEFGVSVVVEVWGPSPVVPAPIRPGG